MAGRIEHRGAGRGSRWTLAYWGAVALALVTPAVAMRFTEEVDWTAFDFAFAAAALGLVGLGLELAVRRTADLRYRAGAALSLATALLVVWSTGAVGIIGTEREPANVLYAAVLLVALAGALLARFRAGGMAWAMAAAAVVQGLVPAIAPLYDPASRELVMSEKVLGVTVLFVVLWLASAWLFRRAAAEPAAKPS